MPTCVPIKAMKDTTRFVEVVNGAKEPVTVTRNGYDTLVVMTPECMTECGLMPPGIGSMNAWPPQRPRGQRETT